MKRVVVPQHTLARELDGETVLVSLERGHYYSFDQTSTSMWRVITAAPSIDAAIAELLGEFDVSEATLRRDIEAWLEDLVSEGLIELADVP